MNLTKIIQTQFSNIQLIFIILSLLAGLISIVFFLRNKYGYSLSFLFLAGLILRLVAATFDPFLNSWDEQFHALVAKNMMNDPLRPMLIANPVLDFDFRDWTSNHIWLHKQPWFLWQIALFFKIFGVSEFVLRVPTAIMMSLMILVIYRIGKLISNPKIAWYGAFLYAFSFYFIHFVSGQVFTDHNDSAFLFYVTLSLWAWLEYDQSGKRKWIYLVGIFVGIAILNKWLIGLLVYSGWFISIFAKKEKKVRIQELKNLGIALVCSLIIALPWQLYILMAYPNETMHVFLFNNNRHFMEALDGHSENRWYHFYLLSQQYGGLIVFFVILPGLYFLGKAMHSKTQKIAVITWLAVPYVFFTLAATKMPMYCTITSTIIFLGLGAILDKGIAWARKYLPARISWWVVMIFLGYLAYDNLYINQLDVWHSNKQSYWKMKNIDAIIDKQVVNNLPAKDYVVFNCGGNDTTMFMFYSGTTAYGFYPDFNQYQTLKSKGIKMATFTDNKIPDFLRKDLSVKKIYLQPFYY
ncbi:MAG: glycosyltransferase family 39 protein [Bacteroidales bacterium]|nr:glycosyltransferase family 39 protein [Bacteroidales bacterium]